MVTPYYFYFFTPFKRQVGLIERNQPDRNIKIKLICSKIEHNGTKSMISRLTAVKREKFAKNKKNTSKERLSLLLFNV